MQKNNEKREFKMTEGDDRFWADLRALSESLGWELGQTLKACFVLGLELISQRVHFTQKGTEDDEE